MTKIIERVIAWVHSRNNKSSKVNWQFTTKDGRATLKKDHIRQFMITMTVLYFLIKARHYGPGSAKAT